MLMSKTFISFSSLVSSNLLHHVYIYPSVENSILPAVTAQVAIGKFHWVEHSSLCGSLWFSHQHPRTGKEQKSQHAKGLGYKWWLLIHSLSKRMNLSLVSFIITGVPALGMVSVWQPWSCFAPCSCPWFFPRPVLQFKEKEIKSVWNL